jgi:hypothetical protein
MYLKLIKFARRFYVCLLNRHKYLKKLDSNKVCSPSTSN